MNFKQSLYTLILCACFSKLIASGLPQEQQFFDHKDRSAKLIEEINVNFNRVNNSKEAGGTYLYNGDSREYSFFGIDPRIELLEIIRRSPDSKKDFFALDLGAGQFGWSEGLAQNLKDHIPQGKSLHVFSLTGENCGVQSHSEGSIHRHHLGSIPIEFLNLEHVQKAVFKANGGTMPKFDLIVSQFTLLHLTDPVGTFVTCYNSLAQGGMIMFDQFPIFFAHSTSHSEIKLDQYQTFLLNTTEEPYLMGQRYSGLPRRYVLKRTKESPLQLPFTYNESLQKQEVRHADEKPRAHYNLPIIPKYMWNKTYDASWAKSDGHIILKGNNYAFFAELYGRNGFWKNQKVEWQSYWVDEKHPDEIREPQHYKCLKNEN